MKAIGLLRGAIDAGGCAITEGGNESGGVSDSCCVTGRLTSEHTKMMKVEPSMTIASSVFSTVPSDSFPLF